MKQGDLLTSKCQTLVNAVNCVGVMGKGIARDFKNAYPDMYEDYRRRCAARSVKLGEPYLYKTNTIGTERWILNFPTKSHWKIKSSQDEIERGLIYLAKNARVWDVTSIAVPPLGCGCGGLDSNQVLMLIKKHLGSLGILIELYNF
jgi:O-acetyl-ADP-ribose deacetylase (regulator of RNase III)